MNVGRLVQIAHQHYLKNHGNISASYISNTSQNLISHLISFQYFTLISHLNISFCKTSSLKKHIRISSQYQLSISFQLLISASHQSISYQHRILASIAAFHLSIHRSSSSQHPPQHLISAYNSEYHISSSSQRLVKASRPNLQSFLII